MLITSPTLLLTLAYPLAATAAKIPISLGSLAFTPDTVTASIGDILEFTFHPVNNSATMSDFHRPCTPAKTGGFHSGFYATSSGQNVIPPPPPIISQSLRPAANITSWIPENRKPPSTL